MCYGRTDRQTDRWASWAAVAARNITFCLHAQPIINMVIAVSQPLTFCTRWSRHMATLFYLVAHRFLQEAIWRYPGEKNAVLVFIAEFPACLPSCYSCFAFYISSRVVILFIQDASTWNELRGPKKTAKLERYPNGRWVGYVEPNFLKKIPQSGICLAPRVLCQCTVVFAWKCRLFCLCVPGQCRIIIFIMLNSISGLDAWYHFRFNVSYGVAVTVRSHQIKFQVIF